MTSSMQRASASILAALACAALAGCGPDEKALPDPTRPPKPVTFHSTPHSENHARSLRTAPEISPLRAESSREKHTFELTAFPDHRMTR